MKKMHLHYGRSMAAWLCFGLYFLGSIGVEIVLAMGNPEPPVITNTPSAVHPGSIDPTFSPGLVQGDIQVLLRQPDGKIWAGGDFYTSGSLFRKNLARFLPNGSVDASFFHNRTNLPAVTAVAVQSGGQVLVGFGGTGVARLLANGQIDTSFNPTLSSDPRIFGFRVTALAVQPDSKVLVAGQAHYASGNEDYWLSPQLLRLQSDGSRDSSFTPFGAHVQQIKVLPDGQLLVAGDGVVRLKSDGRVDESFYAHVNSVYSLEIQPDGKILIGGKFYLVNGKRQSGLARLLSNGGLDLAFSPILGSLSNDFEVDALTVQPDGRILVGGNFTVVGDQLREGLARLNSDGSVDPTFVPRVGLLDDETSRVMALLMQSGNQAIVGGRALGSYGDFNVSGWFRIFLNEVRTNLPPSVAITCPTNGEVFLAPATIRIEAPVTDPDGVCYTAEFLANGQKIGQSTIMTLVAPQPGTTMNHEFTWAIVPAGSYRLTAQATDQQGALGISEPVQITVRETTTNHHELHVVGIYSGTVSGGGSSRTHEQGQASLVVNRPGQQVTLFLCSYEPILWQATISPGTTIEKVYLAGYYRQEIQGLPLGTEVVPLWYEGRFDDYLWIGYAIESGQFYNSIPKINRRTGLEISSFHGGYQAPYPSPFVIDTVQNDPRLSTNYPVVVSPTQVPALTFSLTFRGTGGGSSAIRRQSYTLHGPVSGSTLLPDTPLVPDARGDYYYGIASHGVWKIETQTGASQELQIPSNLPDLSWSMGLGFDTRRQRVLLVSLGGEGFLYGYAPAQDQWSVVRSMENRDLDNLVYHPQQDALYGVSVIHGDEALPYLYRFNAEGVYQNQFALPHQPFGCGPSSFQSELVSAGDYLVWLVESTGWSGYASYIRESRIYLIDLEAQRVWLTFRQVVEPPIATVTWQNPAPIQYGTSLSSSQLNATANVTGSFDYHPPAGSVLEAGTHTLTCTFSPQNPWSGNAIITRVSLVVERAPLTIRADDKTRNQGQPNPMLTASYEGLVNYDTPESLDIPVQLSTTATSNSPPGDYPILASGASDANYTITYVNGTLTILPIAGPGSLDLSFRPSIELDQHEAVNAIAVQNDGKILVGGNFHQVNGKSQFNLARLNLDASLDHSFEWSAPWFYVKALAVQPDGKILVAGSGHEGPIRNGLLRLEVDGSRDPSFHYFAATTNYSVPVRCLALQPDGRILVSGTWPNPAPDGNSSNFLARLNIDGSLDSSFQPHGVRDLDNFWINSIALQADGKIIAGGYQFIDQHGLRNLARFHPDGQIDLSFQPDYDDTVYAVALQPDGRVLVAGASVVRLNSDGSRDASFQNWLPGTGAWSAGAVLALQSDGGILFGGRCFAGEGAAQQEFDFLVRLHHNGSLDNSFKTDIAQEGANAGWFMLNALELQADGKILIGGVFNRVNGVAVDNFARLNNDLSLLPPMIHSIAPRWASPGATLTIQGAHFSRHPAVNIVYFGAVKASVISATATSLLVNVPNGATYAPVTVTVNGLTAESAVPFLPSFAEHDVINIDTFASRLDFLTGDGPHEVALGDFDGDGDPDLAVANAYGHQLTLHQNLMPPGGVFTTTSLARVDLPANPSPYSPFSQRVADVDSDGKLDVVVVNNVDGTASVFRNQNLEGTLTTNSFAPRMDLLIGPEVNLDVDLRDLNNDGKPDLVTANDSTDTISIRQNLSQPGHVNFGARVDLPVDDQPHRLALADLDGDGKTDLAVVNRWGGTISIYRNIGTPGADLASASFAPRLDLEGLPGCVSILAGDLDGDGKPDLIVGSWNNQFVAVLRNLSSPGNLTVNSFAPPIFYNTEGNVHGLALGDLNGDGRLDLAVVTELPSHLSVFPNQGSAGAWTVNSFAERVDYATGWNAAGVAIGDINGDGKPDIMVAVAYDDLISVYLNHPSPTAWTVRQMPATYVPGQAFTVQLLASPRSNIAAYAVEEIPPAGWTVSEISHNGTFDQATGKVKYGPFFDDTTRTLSYVLTPPTNANGTQHFSGTASADGQNTRIGGADRIEQYLLHPADLDPANSTLAIAEVTAYGAAWRQGSNWVRPPNPIPIDYVTRASALWKGGELYYFESSLPAPLCWINLQLDILMPLRIASAVPEGIRTTWPSAVERQLPTGFVPGEPVTVKLVATPARDAAAYALEEQVPSGWTVTQLSHEGVIDKTNGKLKWGPFFDANPRVLSYQAVAPIDTRVPCSFAGVGSFDGQSTTITGAGQSVPSCRLTATGRTDSGRYCFQLTGHTGATMVIETSTDLRTWTTLETLIPTSNQIELSTPAATDAAHRFYRARIIE